VAVPPLRSVQTGDVCDRWAIDVAGPLPRTVNGNRYVIAAVEYTTRYVAAEAVPEHTATAIARFLMDRVVLVYGPMREIIMDGAMEFGTKATAELLKLMQTKQATPVPYRPNLLRLVERFHMTWKDMISLYVDEGQDDWDDFVPCALYAYNSSPHATHGFQPNALMLGRKLRSPAALLRRSRLVHPHRKLEAYHEALLQDLKTARELAAVALQKEQARQAMYYNRRNILPHAPFRPDQLVWVYRPARGPKITKFGHRWRGPSQVVEAAGYDNYLVRMLETGKELVTHCSFLLFYYYPTHLLDQMARDIELDLRDEAVVAADADSEDEEQDAEGVDAEVEADDSGERPAAAPEDSRAAPTRHDAWSAEDSDSRVAGAARTEDSSVTTPTGGQEEASEVIAEDAVVATDQPSNREDVAVVVEQPDARGDAAPKPTSAIGKRKRRTSTVPAATDVDDDINAEARGDRGGRSPADERSKGVSHPNIRPQRRPAAARRQRNRARKRRAVDSSPNNSGRLGGRD
jgi:hypothetical protein